jgi:hypothetical protein
MPTPGRLCPTAMLTIRGRFVTMAPGAHPPEPHAAYP